MADDKASKAGYTVLVVDDVDIMHMVLRQMLGMLGFPKVISALDGKRAQRILETEKIDLIISDWSMPELSGIALLRFVRNNTAWAHIPFIMLTSDTAKNSILEAKRAGVDDYILKPFNAATLEAKINGVLKLTPQTPAQ
ncbi:MAG: response regulator [Desulfurivibrionaceae bacterium]|jgi:two-component system chemotaxis response regulator CheY